MSPRKVSELAFGSIVVSVMALVISLSWNDVFNTTVHYITQRVGGVEHGSNELIMRITWALVLTLIGVLVVPVLVKRFSRNSKQQ